MIPNLKLVDETLNIWRGGQPVSPEDWSDLKANGVETIVKLNMDSEGSDQGAVGAGIQIQKLEESFLVQFFTEPNIDDFLMVVRMLTKNFFVHCTYGRNRTSAFVGIWRVVMQGWSTADAFAEMIQNGFRYPMPEPGLEKLWADFKTYWENRTATK